MHVRLPAVDPSIFFSFPVASLSLSLRRIFFPSLLFLFSENPKRLRTAPLSLDLPHLQSTSDLSVRASASGRHSFIKLSSARHAHHRPEINSNRCTIEAAAKTISLAEE
ncbi:unnamed protein product [Prunus armeniaca]|uniref:Uncharacterized protein n=1 Tax=Prunus armeniaca TaxID=36596 RepID=A0A6J5UDF3_PRUAR|nr:unnamed protein product [Prunus armeniaca]CAB4304004.1 unnamed protein product [Prunus armeniaca]